MAHPKYMIKSDPDDHFDDWVVVVVDKETGREVKRFRGDTKAEAEGRAEEWIGDRTEGE